MPKHTYIFMRHGEAEHNVAAAEVGDAAYRDPQFKDAPLTAKGREQVLQSARKLSEVYPKIDYIWSSPLTRTIQTARCVTEIIPCEQKIILSDSLIEAQGGGHICNSRLPMPLLVDINPDTVAYNIMNYNYPDLNEDYAVNRAREDERSMRWRAERFKNSLQHYTPTGIDRTKDLTILIVSHHDTLKAWFGPSLMNAEYIIRGLEDIRTPYIRSL